MGKKYIIELEDAPFVDINGDRLWRVKGFRSLVFDSDGLKRLTSADTAVDPKEIRLGDIVVDEDDIRFLVLDVNDGYVEALSETGCYQRLIVEDVVCVIRHMENFCKIVEEIGRIPNEKQRNRPH